MVSVKKHRFFFFSISFVRISYKTIWLKTWSWYKTHWKMKSGRAKIGTPSPWKRRKTTSSAIFSATGAWGLIKLDLIYSSTRNCYDVSLRKFSGSPFSPESGYSPNSPDSPISPDSPDSPETPRFYRQRIRVLCSNFSSFRFRIW